MDKLSPVGVFDSGVGGFSVVKEIQKVLPGEDVLYYGDSANMPYGNRSGEEILHLTRQILAFLERRGVKAAAVACNTISSLIDRTATIIRSRFSASSKRAPLPWRRWTPIAPE